MRTRIPTRDPMEVDGIKKLQEQTAAEPDALLAPLHQPLDKENAPAEFLRYNEGLGMGARLRPARAA